MHVRYIIRSNLHLRIYIRRCAPHTHPIRRRRAFTYNLTSFPQIATYDLQPQMSVQGVADEVASIIESKKFDFVMCNFAPPDMVCLPPHAFRPSFSRHRVVATVASRYLHQPNLPQVGHTGNFDGAVSAITHTDTAVGTVYAACQAAGYVLLITADHGNAEQMRNPETGARRTPHTPATPCPLFLLAAGMRWSLMSRMRRRIT